MMKNMLKFTSQPQLENPSLIVGWSQDTAKLSPRVIDYLNHKINSQSFCDIEPVGFFSLAGVAIENNVADFPESRFYFSQPNNLVVFKSGEPQFERYKFLNAILDVATHYCKIKELFTVNGIISPIAHTNSREISAVSNQPEIQKNLKDYGLKNMNWQGTPAISSYLLWVAKSRGIPGVSLWTEIPFYLGACEDFQAIKLTLSFLNNRFDLSMDFGELDDQINNQDLKIAQLRKENPEINKCIGTLESGLSLSEHEQMELIKAVTELLSQSD
jgi:proteasome assembly chaperone (PAC2) family protein